MTVSELIKELKKLPQDAVVHVYDPGYDGWLAEVGEIEHVHTIKVHKTVVNGEVEQDEEHVTHNVTINPGKI